MLLSVLVTSVSAKPVVYEKASEQYNGRKYYNNLTSLELTGDMRADLVAVAISQLFYREGNSIQDLHGQKAGNGNFTEFNYEYGELDQEGNGVLTYGYPWCASFITFCLKRAGIPKTLCPQHVNCTSWLNIFKKGSSDYSYKDAGSYTPIMGDIVFFKTSSTSSRPSDHVGIVLSADKDCLYTIEGNTGGGVFFKTYDIDNSKIVGFGVPKYKTKITESNPGDTYAINAKVILSMRDRPSEAGEKIDTLNYASEVKIIERKPGWVKVNHGGKTGWIVSSYLTPSKYLPVNVKFESGSESKSIDVWKGAKISVPVPTSNYGEFSGFNDLNDSEAPEITGEISEGRIIMSFDKDVNLSPVFTVQDSHPAEESTFENSDTASEEKSGCGSLISSAFPILFLLAFSFVTVKNDE